MSWGRQPIYYIDRGGTRRATGLLAPAQRFPSENEVSKLDARCPCLKLRLNENPVDGA